LTFVNSDRELPIDLAENDEMRAYLEQEMQKKGVDEQKAREKEFNVMLEDCNRLIKIYECSVEIVFSVGSNRDNILTNLIRRPALLLCM